LLKIYCERNTGTNYLFELIRTNLEVDLFTGVAPQCIQTLQKILPGNELIRDLYFYFTYQKNLGWKHSVVKPSDIIKKNSATISQLLFVTITKNPYSWLLSLHNKPYHQLFKKKLSFEDFLTSKWVTVGRENMPREISSPVELWNQKNASYISLKQTLPTLNLKYEDLLADPEAIIALIGESFSLDIKGLEFVNLEQSTKESGKDFSFYQKYYLEEKWKEKLLKSSIDIINEKLNDDVLEYFGYKKL